jgi:DNA-binding NarL/FixJ family response regulator
MRAKTDRAIRLMLVERPPGVRAGLANLLSGEPGFSSWHRRAKRVRRWPAGVNTGPTSCCWISACRGWTALRCSGRSRRSAAEAHVLMLTSSEAKEDVRQSMAAGRRDT